MKRLLAVAALACAAAIGSSAPAEAEEAPFIDWNPLLPGLATPYRPSREQDCVDGSNQCIEETLTEMYRRFDRLYATCDHNAAFGITYIRVTEGVRQSVLSGLYDEPKFLNHEDKVFARMYFNSFDAWKAGEREQVPPAWRLALDSGRDKTNAGIGDLLMSMNAHIQRDMPFMLDALGLTRPDNVNRKLDHDKGNRMLAPLFDDVLAELGARFDITTARFNIPGTFIDDIALFQVLQVWREQVWRNAELLGASDALPGLRPLVASMIENYALGFGQLIKTATTILPGPAKLRDANCAAYKRTHRETGGLLAASVAKKGLRARKGAVRLRVTCPELRDCRGTAVLTRRGKAMSTSRAVALRAGESTVVSLKLKRSAMRAVRASRRLSVRAATASPSPWGTTRTGSQLTRVRA